MFQRIAVNWSQLSRLSTFCVVLQVSELNALRHGALISSLGTGGRGWLLRELCLQDLLQGGASGIDRGWGSELKLVVFMEAKRKLDSKSSIKSVWQPIVAEVKGAFLVIVES